MLFLVPLLLLHDRGGELKTKVHNFLYEVCPVSRLTVFPEVDAAVALLSQ